MLVHLQSFNSIPEHYTIPESTKNGVPLFYIPPGSTAPVRAIISLIHHLTSTYCLGVIVLTLSVERQAICDLVVSLNT